MSSPTGAVGGEGLRAFAFGDQERELWGAAWLPPGGEQQAVIAAGGGTSSIAGSVEGEKPNEPWRLEGGGSALVLEGLGDPVEEESGPPPSFDQLCRVTGRVTVGASAHEVSCLGWRAVRPPSILQRRVASLRQVAAWLAADEGFALLALRSAGAKGQEGDTVSGVMFAPAESKPVAEPRLSTTYAESGEPVRAGVELWIQAGDDPDQQYPRRAVGAATRGSFRWTVGDLALEALPFRWHTSAREGPGIYLVGRRG